MRCAFCGSGLSPYVTPESLSLEVCSGCRALRLDPGELEALLGTTSPPDLVRALPRPDAPSIACGRCDHPELHSLAPPNADTPNVFECPRCASWWVRPADFALLRREGNLRGSRRPSVSRPKALLETQAPSTRRTLERLLRRVRDSVVAIAAQDPSALYFLLVFLGAWSFSLTEFGAFFGSIVSMPFHEFGHASASWLNGRFAIPLPFFTFWREERSLSLTLLLLVGSSAGVWFFRKRAEATPMVGSGVIGGLVFVAWLSLSPHRALEAQILGGFLGEIVIAALPLCLYFARAPHEVRWDFWRFFAIVPASLSFTHALVLWTQARANRSLLPWGSALGSEGDGDLNRLVREFGWSEDGLITLFEGTAGVAAILVLTIVLVRVRSALARGEPASVDLSERPAAVRGGE